MIAEIKLCAVHDGKPGKQFLKSQDVYDEFKCLSGEMQENFYVINLNSKNKVLNKNLVSIGSSQACLCYPSDVFRAAIVQNASAIFVVHNHPSGDPAPSTQDIEITKRLKSSGEIIGINLLDHVIVGDNDYYSMREGGFI